MENTSNASRSHGLDVGFVNGRECFQKIGSYLYGVCSLEARRMEGKSFAVISATK